MLKRIDFRVRCLTVLVTGATGFIGAWVVRSLHKLGLPLVMTDVRPDFSRLSVLLPDVGSLTFVEGDIVEPGFIASVVEKHKVDRIIHLAALQIPACRQDPIRGAMVNVTGTLRVFEAAKQSDRVKRIVYASSAAVFGPPSLYPSKPVKEDVLLKPTTHYGAFKVCNENCAAAYWAGHRIPSAGLRPHTVYGFGRDVGLTSDITTAMKAAVLDLPFRIRFGGLIDLQYAADVADAFVQCALADLDGARIYNIRGMVREVSEVVRTIEAIVPSSKGKITNETAPLPILAEFDDSALQRDAGPLRITPLEEGFRETIEVFSHLRDEGKLGPKDVVAVS